MGRPLLRRSGQPIFCVQDRGCALWNVNSPARLGIGSEGEVVFVSHDEIMSSDGEGVSGADGAHSGFFMSLLYQYPELVAIKYMADKGTVVFRYTLQRSLSPTEFETIKADLDQSLSVVASLTKRSVVVSEVKGIHAAPLYIIEIVRDLASLQAGELSLIANYLREKHGEDLVYELLPAADGGVVNVPPAMVDHLLNDVRRTPLDHGLIAYREHGQVILARTNGGRISDKLSL